MGSKLGLSVDYAVGVFFSCGEADVESEASPSEDRYDLLPVAINGGLGGFEVLRRIDRPSMAQRDILTLDV